MLMLATLLGIGPNLRADVDLGSDAPGFLDAPMINVRALAPALAGSDVATMLWRPSRQLADRIAPGDQTVKKGNVTNTPIDGVARAAGPSGLDSAELPGRSAQGKVGPYRVLGLLGQGAYGAVYRAWDTRLERDVALKSPHHEPQNEIEVEEFLREARAAGQLQHPNIVSVHDAGVFDGCYFIATEYVAGTSLRHQLSAGRRFSPRQAAEFLLPLANAIHYAHNRGVIHRDIKPENILVDAVGEPHVADFGLARRRRSDPHVTLKGVLGTPAYLSPEQIEDRGVDTRSDLWALGVVLYEMLAGCRPFRGKNMSELIARILAADPVPVPKSRAESAPELAQLTLRLLSKDPEHRPQDANEILRLLGQSTPGSTPFPIPTSQPSGKSMLGWGDRHGRRKGTGSSAG